MYFYKAEVNMREFKDIPLEYISIVYTHKCCNVVFPVMYAEVEMDPNRVYLAVKYTHYVIGIIKRLEKMAKDLGLRYKIDASNVLTRANGDPRAYVPLDVRVDLYSAKGSLSLYRGLYGDVYVKAPRSPPRSLQASSVRDALGFLQAVLTGLGFLDPQPHPSPSTRQQTSDGDISSSSESTYAQVAS